MLSRFGIFLFFFISTTSAWAAAPCFSIEPQQKIGEACTPVRVTVTLKECSTGDIIKKVERTAEYDCQENPRRLRVWSDGDLLYGEVEKQGADYVILSNYYAGGERRASSEKAAERK